VTGSTSYHRRVPAQPGPRQHLALVEYLGTCALDADVVVALSPIALQQCLDRDLDVTVLDDHVDRLALQADHLDFHRWQRGWIDRLDASSRLNGSARTAALAIKGPVDTAVVTSRNLRKLLQTLEPSYVSYVDRARPAPRHTAAPGGLYLWGDDAEPRPAGRLIAGICDDLGIDFGLVVDPKTSALSTRRSTRARFRRWVGRHIGPRRTFWVARRNERQRPTTVMTWYGGYGARAFLDAELRAGRRVFFLARGNRSSRLLEPRTIVWRRRSSRIRLERGAGSSFSPATSEILEEIDNWSGTPGTASVIRNRLTYILGTMCPAIEAGAKALEPALTRSRVDRVAAANPSSTEEFATLLAADRACARRSLVQHGDHLMTYEHWVINDLANCDEWVCSDPTVPDEVIPLCDAIGVRPPAFTFEAHRQRVVEGMAGHASRIWDALPICYVPGLYQGGSTFFRGWLDDAWYFRWQRLLLQWMAGRPDHTFLWKAFPPGNHTEDPIPALIDKMGVGNVRFETRPFTAVLSSVGRTIFDVASTPLFEAVQAGKPALAISFDRFIPLRPAAAALFDTVLRRCDTEEQALAEMEHFMAGDPDLWILDLRRLAGPATE
jgi:hypothetical protein